jgi:hypothetical protein
MSIGLANHSCSSESPVPWTESLERKPSEACARSDDSHARKRSFRSWRRGLWLLFRRCRTGRFLPWGGLALWWFLCCSIKVDEDGRCWIGTGGFGYVSVYGNCRNEAGVRVQSSSSTSSRNRCVTCCGHAYSRHQQYDRITEWCCLVILSRGIISNECTLVYQTTSIRSIYIPITLHLESQHLRKMQASVQASAVVFWYGTRDLGS